MSFFVHIFHSHISVIAACTFLGQSRKHKPCKDSIEARLHQTEVLVGIMLASCDPRTKSSLRDIVRNSAAHKLPVLMPLHMASKVAGRIMVPIIKNHESL